MKGLQVDNTMPAFRSLASAFLISTVAAGFTISLKSQSTTPTLRVTSDLVFLDVTVVNTKGQPVVTGLKKDDFTITEDGKPERIFSFEAPLPTTATAAIVASAILPERDQATQNQTSEQESATILVLDLMNTPSKDQATARDSIRRYLGRQSERLASPTALMVLNNTALDLIQPLTQNRNDLVDALSHVPPLTPYKLGTMQFGSGAWLDQRLSQSIEALQQIAMQNRGRPGRKIVLWVGDGGPSIPVSKQDPRHDKEMRFYQHTTTNMLVDARITLFLIRPEGMQGYCTGLRVFGSCLQNTTDVYDTDPFAGNINFGNFINGTGGKLYAGRNDTDRAIGEAQDFASKAYTLTYQPTAGESNGKFRTIEVTLRDPKLRAVTKAGYYAPEPTANHDAMPHHIDPMYEIEEAAHAGAVVDTLGISLQHVARHPDNGTVELTALLKSTHLRWQPTNDGHSSADITVAAVSLSRQGDILASRLQRLTIFSDGQDPARLAASETPVTITVPMPRQTETVRMSVLVQDTDETGTVELKQNVLASAPESPTPIPQLEERPATSPQPRP